MTNNLDLAQVAPSQNNKETTINNQAGQLDAALTEVLTIEVDDSNAYALSASQFRRHFFIVVTEGSPAPTAVIAVQVPAIRRGPFKLLNLTSQVVSIEVAGQSEPAPQIAPGENRMLSCDGSDVRAAGIGTPDLGGASIGELLDVNISGIAAGQQLRWDGSALVPTTEPFDVGLHLPDLSTAGALLAEIVLARPVDLPAGFTGSTGYARLVATAETVLDVQKNGSSLGTVTFAAASSTPVFALASATSFAAGDRLGIVNEDPADATLAGVSLTFAGSRGS
jgi:hypothetical protein